MNVIFAIRSAKLAIALAATAIPLSPVAVRGERVGYNFTGTLTGSSNISLFGSTVARPSPVSGTFAFDTTTPGVDLQPGVRSYHQYIQGGYTLNINNGQLKLSAHDYIITVGNDQRSPLADYFNVTYANFNVTPVPPPIEVNGVAWDGTKIGTINLDLSWPANYFTDPDEPKLTSARPATSSPGVLAFVGSANSGSGVTPRFFTMTSISTIAPLTGDYNRDGKVDSSDYVEWRKVFDGATADRLYADGNIDGVVDAADYIVWRRAMTAGGAAGTGILNVPEPVGALLPLVAFFRVTSQRRRRWPF